MNKINYEELRKNILKLDKIQGRISQAYYKKIREQKAEKITKEELYQYFDTIHEKEEKIKKDFKKMLLEYVKPAIVSVLYKYNGKRNGKQTGIKAQKEFKELTDLYYCKLYLVSGDNKNSNYITICYNNSIYLYINIPYMNILQDNVIQFTDAYSIMECNAE